MGWRERGEKREGEWRGEIKRERESESEKGGASEKESKERES